MYNYFVWGYKFHFSQKNAQECKLHVSFLKKLPKCFPQRLYPFTFPAARDGWFSFSASVSAFDVTSFDFNHADRCLVISLWFVSCVSLMVNNVEDLSTCWFAICMYSSVKSQAVLLDRSGRTPGLVHPTGLSSLSKTTGSLPLGGPACQ